MPLLEIVTRHLPDRRRHALERQRQSLRLALKGDTRWCQTILADHHRLGVPASHVRLRSFHPHGDFVWILDDDDRAATNPIPLLDLDRDLHVFRMRYAWTKGLTLPPPFLWNDRRLVQGFVGAPCIIVSYKTWMACRDAWGDRYEGDYDFIATAYDYATRYSGVRWVDEVVAWIDHARGT